MSDLRFKDQVRPDEFAEQEEGSNAATQNTVPFASQVVAVANDDEYHQLQREVELHRELEMKNRELEEHRLRIDELERNEQHNRVASAANTEPVAVVDDADTSSNNESSTKTNSKCRRCILGIAVFVVVGVAVVAAVILLRNPSTPSLAPTAEQSSTLRGQPTLPPTILSQPVVVPTIAPQEVCGFPAMVSNIITIPTSTIPTCIGQLAQLTTLELNNQSFVGTIPMQMAQLTKLRQLGMHINALTGSIPPQLSTLTELTNLDLGKNQLRGTVPTQLGLLTALTWLSLLGNELTGTIPTQIGLLTQLEGLGLSENELRGTIPADLGLLTALTWLYLRNNNLTGTIPDWVVQVSCAGGCRVAPGKTSPRCSEGEAYVAHCLYRTRHSL